MFEQETLNAEQFTLILEEMGFVESADFAHLWASSEETFKFDIDYWAEGAMQHGGSGFEICLTGGDTFLYAGDEEPPFDPRIPSGFRAYDSRGHFMVDADGDLHLTPGYRDYFNQTVIDYRGVLLDLTQIGFESGLGVGAGFVRALLAALMTALDTMEEIEDNDDVASNTQ